MAAWCLPKSLSNAFLGAIRSGELAPERLMDMSSAERREAFGKILGEDNAREVNAQFEAKLLLKDQKAGLVNWAQKIGGLTEPARRDILATIDRLDKVLQPEDERAFLADLAAKRLGVTVTADEAKQIFELSQTAEKLRQDIVNRAGNYRDGWTPEAGTAYGRAVMNLTDAIESMKPNGRTMLNKISDILNIPQTALTSILHFSAPFVQGWGMLSTKVAWQGFAQMFEYFRSEENYKNLQAYIIGHPDYEIARQAKLGLTKLGDKLSAREEAIQSTLVEQANQYLTDHVGIPNLVHASSRSFTGYLNYVRFSRYTQLLDAARMVGEDIRPGTQAARDIANAVNDFTGRGNLGREDRYASASPALNATFFSPRKLSATINMFNPERYLNPRISKTARQAALRQLTGSLVATGAVMALAKAMGAQVNADPRSADFAKININGEKLDMTGGNAAYVRLLGRLATGEEINRNGKLIVYSNSDHQGARSRADAAINFMRGKLSPIASSIADAFYGKNMAGQPFSLTDEMRDKLIPITISDAINFYQNDPGNYVAMAPALAALFGVGLESPLPPASRSGRNVWGEPVHDGLLGQSTPPNWNADPVNQELKAVGYVPNFPMRTIRKVPLTDQQYDDYVSTSGRLAHMRLTDVVGMPGWDALPAAVRLGIIKSTVSKARDMAATSVMLQSPEIMQQATQAKIAEMGLEAPVPQ